MVPLTRVLQLRCVPLLLTDVPHGSRPKQQLRCSQVGRHDTVLHSHSAVFPTVGPAGAAWAAAPRALESAGRAARRERREEVRLPALTLATTVYKLQHSTLNRQRAESVKQIQRNGEEKLETIRTIYEDFAFMPILNFPELTVALTQLSYIPLTYLSC